MGWTSNDYNHEGWVAFVAPDGRLSGSSTGAGVLFHGITGEYPHAGEFNPDEEIVPNDLIMSWRGACTCGWQGELWQRVPTAADADLATRKEYVPSGEFADVSGEVEEAVREEWLVHIAPSEAILGVEAAAKEHRQAGLRLDKTVAAAKAAGASWTDIGRAAGISRQAAHERWAAK
ncbi:hypothetical protein HAV21_17180 [Paenarthrobacter sp. MSM-2-10-13]|uniref:hypothetical protein n=1 Tax=Micrococcaceae TaxID=1268 RepID=UPI00115D232B|nr:MULTISPECIES: hypothetical protein [Micrococcaceae]NHW48608.1 hypothetical protein [Paenarthrobacter sp. MSM-2-10-13]QSZ51364.1 hypothetical protein AYX22_22855 [Arthrobacter sp. D5-1]TQS87746.1 hypothetical protein EU811_21795 [Arthrobacter sp. TS-15]